MYRTYVAESINSEQLLLIDSATYTYAHQDQIATGYYAMHLTKTKIVVFAANNDCLPSHPVNKDELGNVSCLWLSIFAPWIAWEVMNRTLVPMA